MPNQDNFSVKEFTSGGGTWTIDLSKDCRDYYIYSDGLKSLAASWSVTTTGTAYDGMKCYIHYSAKATLGGNKITIFGTELTQQQALSDCLIVARYNGSSWVVSVFVSDNDMPNVYDGVNTYSMNGSGGTITLISGIDKKYQRITGSGTLSGSYVWTFGRTPKEGDEFVIHYNATFSLASNTITIGGNVLTALQASGGNTIVLCKYNGSAWICTPLNADTNNNNFRVMGSSGDTSPAFLDDKVKRSIEVDSNKIQLVGDSDSIPNNSYYGKDSTGTQGYVQQPKVFKGVITDAGSDTINTSEVYNTIGSVVISSGTAGVINVDCDDAFTENKTFVMIGFNVNSKFIKPSVSWEWTSADSITINTYENAVLTDEMLFNASILIEVYP